MALPITEEPARKTVLTIPALKRLQGAESVLVAGCGGGFDVYAGVPIAETLRKAGKKVVLANLSFTALPHSGAERIPPAVWRIDRQSSPMGYFPERWLNESLALRGVSWPIYAFEKAAPAAVAEGYRYIIGEHGIDLVLLVDGGTDSIIFGDEPGLGTIVEDAVSVVAAHSVAGDRAMLACIGFGIDHFHGVSHHSFLQNTAQLIRDGGYLGSISLTPGTEEAGLLADVVAFANRQQPEHKSIVMNSIVSALEGAFGDHHATERTEGSELFINPLMPQYWFYEAGKVVKRMTFAEKLMFAQSFQHAYAIIAEVSEAQEPRPRLPIPL
ncbi:MAG: DUF1152 domain-containing protein [Kiloniellales bacterium]|nr:DUF1152 domain-containing protein [Kiloniellales bacterium]